MNCKTTFKTLQPKQKCCCKKCAKQLWKIETEALGHIKYGNVGCKKGNIPWNKGKKCEQLAGKNNGFYNKTHTEKTKEKIKNGVYNTKRKNHSFNTSKEEDFVYLKLQLKYKNVLTQYKDNLRYPFACDFYIPSLDLFIEYQGHWTHGIYNHKILGPYNPNNLEHQKVLKIWRNKNTKYFNQAIYTWTILDPKKQQFIEKNNLNFIKFYSIREFMEWYNLD